MGQRAAVGLGIRPDAGVEALLVGTVGGGAAVAGIHHTRRTTWELESGSWRLEPSPE